jgi:hypothetical protein
LSETSSYATKMAGSLVPLNTRFAIAAGAFADAIF